MNAETSAGCPIIYQKDMNIVPIDQATSSFIKRKGSKYAPLREAISGLSDDQALFVPFAEHSEKALLANVATLRRSREQHSLSLRKHEDGSGMFIFFTPNKG